MSWEPWDSSASPVGPEPDLLVLDTYERDGWARLAATPHGRLVAFADAVTTLSRADVVIAPAGDFVAHEQTRVLDGLRFACLRRAFWDPPSREIREPAHKVLVTTGGGDFDGLAEQIAEGLSDRFPGVTVELVWGPGFEGKPPKTGITVLERPRSLDGALWGSDAVVCTGGQTLLEAAATGAPAVAIEAAPNQRSQIEALTSQGAALAAKNEDEVTHLVQRLLGSASLRGELSRRSQEAIDGRGASRAASVLRQLLR